MKPIPDLNHKQEELLHSLFNQVQERFPDIEWQEIGYNPEDKEHIHLYVISYLSEEEEIAMMNYAGVVTTDILLDTGYYFSIIPRLPELQSA